MLSSYACQSGNLIKNSFHAASASSGVSFLPSFISGSSIFSTLYRFSPSVDSRFVDSPTSHFIVLISGSPLRRQGHHACLSTPSFCMLTISLCESCSCQMAESTSMRAWSVPSTIGSAPRTPMRRDCTPILHTTSCLRVPGGRATASVSSFSSCVHLYRSSTLPLRTTMSPPPPPPPCLPLPPLPLLSPLALLALRSRASAS
mmetsp:Transcript_4977/g.10846  ORF Transcript_4977/g.10846 Transcript_4977/m.10846 type:complete len:202 (-) Transcript_4977:551-1156(-)